MKLELWLVINNAIGNASLYNNMSDSKTTLIRNLDIILANLVVTWSCLQEEAAEQGAVRSEKLTFV